MIVTYSVPNLQFDGLAVELDGANLKVHSDGGNVGLGVGVVSESEQQTGFADSGVSNQEQLEQVVAKKGKQSVSMDIKDMKYETNASTPCLI